MGPTVVRGNEFATVELRVDDDRKQFSSTTEFIFDTTSLVEYISSVMTLHPGTVITTGTPGGVGIFRDPPDLLEPGQTVTATIDDIGTLRNPVVAEEPRN